MHYCACMYGIDLRTQRHNCASCVGWETPDDVVDADDVVAVFVAMLVVASIETQSNGFFVQTRVGQWGKLFKIFKIKVFLHIVHK